MPKPSRRSLGASCLRAPAWAAALMLMCSCGSRLAPGVSRQALLALRPGMPSLQVQELLGAPLRVETPLARTRSTPEEYSSKIVWIYAEPRGGPGGIEIYLLFSKDQLESATAEYYDLRFFQCDGNKCPSVSNESDWERLPTHSGIGSQ